MDDPGTEQLGSLTLPGDLKSAAPARRFVERLLDGRVEDLPAVALMTSELVTNVAHHAPSDLTLTVRAGPPIRVEVHDGVAATEAFRDLQSQLEGTENRIAVERMRFNEVARDYNTARRRFPTVLIASLMGFDARPYFEDEQGADQPPPVKF